MALRNDETISDLGKRIISLMEDKRIASPKELATVFYDQGLVHVKTRIVDNPEYDNRVSAIGSIEKKIVRHIKTGQIADNSGEYIYAYCHTLICSSDYLLGLTDIRTPDYDIRRMAEMTGLDETVIGKFIDYHDEDNQHIADWWSYILNQELFEEIPDSLEYAAQNLEEQYRIEAILTAIQWQLDHCPKDHSKDNIRLNSDYSEYEEQLDSIIPSFQGLLYKISRAFTDIVEKRIIESQKNYRKTELEENLNHVQELAEQDIHYFNFRAHESEVSPIPDDIWEQLPQSYPMEGAGLAKKLMNERLKVQNEAFHRNHPQYTEKP